MPQILIVDDNPIDRTLLCGLLASIPGTEVRGVTNGREAMELLSRAPVDLLVTDLLMPEMDGLELTVEVRKTRPHVPVILTTGLGDETIGEQALRAGATDFVPKSRAGDWLVPMAIHLLAVTRDTGFDPRLIEKLSSVQFSFSLGNSLEMVPAVADLVRSMVSALWRCDDTEKIRIGVILEHAMLYAMIYSNLELDDDQLVNCDTWTLRLGQHPLLAERTKRAPFAQRQLQVHAAVTLSEARFTLRAEGRRLMPAAVQAPGSWCDFAAPLGRTLMMMSLLLDGTSFDESTNELVLIRRRGAIPAAV